LVARDYSLNILTLTILISFYSELFVWSGQIVLPLPGGNVDIPSRTISLFQPTIGSVSITAIGLDSRERGQWIVLIYGFSLADSAAMSSILLFFGTVWGM
jgi:hypothetical protein